MSVHNNLSLVPSQSSSQSSRQQPDDKQVKRPRQNQAQQVEVLRNNQQILLPTLEVLYQQKNRLTLLAYVKLFTKIGKSSLEHLIWERKE